MAFLEKFQAAPLSSGFFFVSILGLLISLFSWDDFGATWSFTFIVFFGAMFIASLISMRKAPIEAEIAVDHHAKKGGKKKKKK